MSERRSVGQPIPHESAVAHVTGAALYTDDLVTRFPGTLHAWPVCAPYAHASLIELDIAAARAVYGVVHVMTIADVIGENDTGPSRRDEPLFPRPSASGGPPEILFHCLQDDLSKLGKVSGPAPVGPKLVLCPQDKRGGIGR